MKVMVSITDNSVVIIQKAVNTLFGLIKSKILEPNFFKQHFLFTAATIEPPAEDNEILLKEQLLPINFQVDLIALAVKIDESFRNTPASIKEQTKPEERIVISGEVEQLVATVLSLDELGEGLDQWYSVESFHTQHSSLQASPIESSLPDSPTRGKRRLSKIVNVPPSSGTNIFKLRIIQENLTTIIKLLLRLLYARCEGEKNIYGVLPEGSTRHNLAMFFVLTALREPLMSLFGDKTPVVTLVDDNRDLTSDEFEINTEDLYYSKGEIQHCSAISGEFNASINESFIVSKSKILFIRQTLDAFKLIPNTQNIANSLIELNAQLNKEIVDESTDAQKTFAWQIEQFIDGLLPVLLQPYSNKRVEELLVFKTMAKGLYNSSAEKNNSAILNTKLFAFYNQLESYIMALQQMHIEKISSENVLLKGELTKTTEVMQQKIKQLTTQHTEELSQLNQEKDALNQHMKKLKKENKALQAQQKTAASTSVAEPERKRRPPSLPAQASNEWVKKEAAQYTIKDDFILERLGLSNQADNTEYNLLHHLQGQMQKDCTTFDDTALTYELHGWKPYYNFRVEARAQKMQALQELRRAHIVGKLTLRRLADITNTQEKTMLYDSLLGSYTSKTKHFFEKVRAHLSSAYRNYDKVYALYERVSQQAKHEKAHYALPLGSLERALDMILAAIAQEDNFYMASQNDQVKIFNDSSTSAANTTNDMVFTNELLRCLVNNGNDYPKFSAERPDLAAVFDNSDWNNIVCLLDTHMTTPVQAMSLKRE